MLQSADPVIYGIAGCLNCNNVFLVTPTQRTCLLCGLEPRFILPFSDNAGASPPDAGPAKTTEAMAVEPTAGAETPVAAGLGEEPTPAVGPTILPLSCPHCQEAVHVVVSEDEIALRSPFPSGVPEEAAAGDAGEAPAAAPSAPEATCLICRCTDSKRCADGCTWIWVDRDREVGVCSRHPEETVPEGPEEPQRPSLGQFDPDQPDPPAAE